MTKIVTLLGASAALALAVGHPALSATWPSGTAAPCGAGVCATALDQAGQTLPLVLASGDDDEGGQASRAHDAEDDDCGEDGGTGCAGARANPAPAGTVPPPANGLFGTGAAPAAVTN